MSDEVSATFLQLLSHNCPILNFLKLSELAALDSSFSGRDRELFHAVLPTTKLSRIAGDDVIRRNKLVWMLRKGIRLERAFLCGEISGCELMSMASVMGHDLVFISVKAIIAKVAIAEADWIAFANGCRTLTDVDFSGRKDITHVVLATLIKRNSQLMKLNLSHCSRLSADKLFASGAFGLMPSLQSLVFNDCATISDSGLQVIAETCPYLTSIALENCLKITDVGIHAILGLCSNLQTCELTSSSRISGDAFVSLYQQEEEDCCSKVLGLKGAKARETISATSTGPVTATLASASASTSASSLSSAKTSSSSATFAPAHFNNTSSLLGSGNLGNGNSTDSSQRRRVPTTGTEIIAALPTSPASPASVSSLVSLSVDTPPPTARPLISTISLDGCFRVDDTGLSALAPLVSGTLTNINLSGCWNVRDAGLSSLAQCKKLKVIKLRDCCNITDEGVDMLVEGCRQIVEISLRCCTQLTDESPRYIAEKCTYLEKLNLHGCTGLTEQSLGHIATGCEYLKTLKINECSMADSGLEILAQGCHQLETLRANNCVGITDSGVVAIANGCTQLKTIDFKDCKHVSDIGVLALANNCSHLEKIQLGGCGNITDASVVPLSRQCAYLSTVQVMGADITDLSVRSLLDNCKQMKTLDLRGCALVTPDTVHHANKDVYVIFWKYSES